jgi:hypothetical protein
LLLLSVIVCIKPEARLLLCRRLRLAVAEDIVTSEGILGGLGRLAKQAGFRSIIVGGVTWDFKTVNKRSD